MQLLGIYAGIGFKNPIEERIAAIKATGFTCVCLNFEAEMLATETDWENQVKLAQKYSLPVQNAHLTGTETNTMWTKSERGDWVKNRLIGELKRLKEVGVPCGVAHVTWGFGVEEAPNEIGLKRYDEIVNAAEKYGVDLALENSVFPEHVHYLFEHLKSKRLGFCYDSGHENAFAPNENYLEKYADRLFAMHLHDNDGKHDEHKIPFEGTIDWRKKVALLNKTELFKRTIVLENGAYGKDLYDGLQQYYKAAVKLAELSKTLFTEENNHA